MVELLAPVRERYAELRPDEAALEADAGRRGREGARDRRPVARRRARADGLRLGQSAANSGPGAGRPAAGLLCSDGVADLDLDLDVFAGPFDLLLAVVLREEVSLLELQLGEVVVAYIEHLEQRGRAGARGGDRVPRPDRRRCWS